MKKNITRYYNVNINCKSYESFFTEVENVKKKLESFGTLDGYISVEGLGYDGDTNDAYISFSCTSLETDEEYADRLEKEQKQKEINEKRKLTLEKARKAKEDQDFALYLKLKRKYETPA